MSAWPSLEDCFAYLLAGARTKVSIIEGHRLIRVGYSRHQTGSTSWLSLSNPCFCCICIAIRRILILLTGVCISRSSRSIRHIDSSLGLSRSTSLNTRFHGVQKEDPLEGMCQHHLCLLRSCN